MMKALEGIRILDVSRVLAGPYCTMMLADFGADVVKIEPPNGGDDSRSFGPFIGSESAYFMSLNRNKRSIVLDLKKEADKSVFKEMVKTADVVVENYRPGTMEKFGLGYETLKEVNPQIIYAACSGFGDSGPYRNKPAYDIIVQAMGGIMSITGEEGGEAMRVGASIGDLAAGMFTAYGVMLALFHRQRTQQGQKVDVAMLDCQVAMLENAVARYAISGSSPQPLGNRHPSITPFAAFTAADGQLIVGAGNDRLWHKLCRVVGHDEWREDSRFSNNGLRTENAAQLMALLNGVFVQKTVEEWLHILEAVEVPCAPINDIEKMMADPQIKAREMIVELKHPRAGVMKVPGIPVKLSKTPGEIASAAPFLGEHTKDILAEAAEKAQERGKTMIWPLAAGN